MCVAVNARYSCFPDSRCKRALLLSGAPTAELLWLSEEENSLQHQTCQQI